MRKEKIMIEIKVRDEEKLIDFEELLIEIMDLYKIKYSGITRVTKYKIIPPKGQVLIA